MKKGIMLFCTVFLALTVQSASAADSLLTLPVSEAMQYRGVSDLFPGDIAFYWGEQSHAAVQTKYGNYKASKRTNALGKSKSDACSWALASALEALQSRARREGGNAVVNIQSNIKDRPESSETSYNCLAGSVMVNVALKGDVVKLAK